MNPPSTGNQLSDLTASSLSSLENCSEESVYAPGYIQAHGILLTLQEPHLKILQVSQNVEQFFNIPAKELLGQPLQRLFSQAQVKRIANFLKQEQLEICNPFELKTQQGVTQANQRRKLQTFRSTLYRTTNLLILELEPLLIEDSHILQSYYHLQTVILRLRSANSLLDLAQVLAQEIKAMTGFDRVMIYRFDADDHGFVVAEEKEAHLESYLGLHYPATDIPVPARNLFYRNWVRHIPDVNSTSVPLQPSYNPLTNTPLDLSACVLRGVSSYHTEYLQNMGVAASLTISLIDDKRLWGLIACHHYSPRLIDYTTRKTCEFIGQFASVELLHQQDRELDQYRTQVKTIQDKLQQAFWREPNFIQQVLTHNASDLLGLVHASGIAIVLDQQITLIGQTPPLEAVQNLLIWLSQLNQHEFYLTNCLTQSYPPGKAFKDTASGILAISVVLHQTSYHLIWFRPEQIHTVHWAGNLQDTIAIDELGKMRLCPRKSFELWKETVRETSLPWQPAEIEAAKMMRNTLMLAVLEFSQAALEQAAERATIANRAKSQFLAKMSHELRTPLNAILGFTQVMNRSLSTPSEFQSHLNIINRSGEHLLALINDVLEMSRIEAGQLILAERHFNLHHLLQSIHDLFALKAAQKGLILAVEKAPDLSRYVCSDEGKLRQILINLISNAIKFTAQGSVTVRAWAEASQQTKQQGCTCWQMSPPCRAFTLSFAVEDTGSGIDACNWESIFEAFMQTEQGRHADGTGLGLSISRQFARLMGGDITVQSTVNQGSIFTCWVVAHWPEMMDLVESERTSIVTELEPGQPAYRILVVEDILENRQLLTTLLEPIGFEVVAVENGKAAIAQWQTWHPHLILMDIGMPVMNGYEATRQIRLQESLIIGEPSFVNYQKSSVEPLKVSTSDKGQGTNGKPSKTKIIALTAYAFETDRIASLEAGCDDYLTKPFTEVALFEMMARHLGVRYRYVDCSPPMSYASERRTLSREDLGLMPWEWRVQVHEAALDLDDARIRQLITEIPQQERWLNEEMIYLVDNFQWEAIALLTQP